MLFGDHLCLVRGGGDLGTGVVLRLHRAGFPVAVCELAEPLAVRRTVAVSTAVTDGEITVDGLTARRVEQVADIGSAVALGVVPVLVSPELPDMARSVVVDARLAKHRLDTTILDASLVVALGPGFVAGEDCHAVVETLRGPRLGRVIWSGPASADTGVPGDGTVAWLRQIGDVVTTGQVLGRVAGREVTATVGGLIRGLIGDGSSVSPGTKIGDIDSRGGEASVHEISDKALAVGGGVVEAVLTWLGCNT